MIFKTNYSIGQFILDPETGVVEQPGSKDNPGYNGYEEPSMTIPGQAMSIQEMLARHVAGLPLDGAKVPLYEADETQPDDDLLMGHPDLSKMDLVDREEYLEQQRERLDVLQKRLAKQKEDHLRSKFERIKAQDDDHGDTAAQPRDPKGTEQYPKKTRGAGAEPRDTRKGSSEAQKGGETDNG